MAVQTGDASMNESVEVFGTTEPISLASASSRDVEGTKKMLHFLDSVAPTESDEGLLERWESLIELEEKITRWLSNRCGIRVPSGKGDIVYALCRVLTFGSFRLGIIRPSSDIDTLVLIPSSVSRDRFFSEFISDILAKDPCVSECLPVTDARVPIAKVKYRGIFLDILVACVPPTAIVAGMDSVDDSLIFKVDEKCMKSMNGIRVADKILKLVPDPRTFREASRMIKYWAQQRCIYGNSVGYFGGVSWSMAVARVCQLYPNFSARQIVERFFYTFASWSWEDNGPILLCHPQEMKIPPSLIRQGGVAVLSQFKDWNPVKYSSDRFQIMPVITPIFPSHNTTYNVTETQKTIMTDEIKRGKDLIQLMHIGGDSVGWADLCAPLPFWDLFGEYLELSISGKTVEVFSRFKGLVESRVRALIRCIEQLDKHIVVRPHPDMFLRDSLSGSFFLGLNVPDTTTVDLRSAIEQFITDTLEKGLQGPEWAGQDLASVIRLEIQVTSDPFPSMMSGTESPEEDQPSEKRQRLSEEMDDALNS
jgi:poly(A) polymerase